MGIMQAVNGAGSPISIPGVMTAESNIHAGVKFLHQMAEQYFSDARVDAENRLLFSFAAYNAGSNRVADLRNRAAEQGLDRNKWFGSELVGTRGVGQVIVQYVITSKSTTWATTNDRGRAIAAVTQVLTTQNSHRISVVCASDRTSELAWELLINSISDVV